MRSTTVLNMSTIQNVNGDPVVALSADHSPNMNVIDAQEWSNQSKEILRYNNVRLKKITTVFKVVNPYACVLKNEQPADQVGPYTTQFDMEMLTKNMQVHFGRSDVNGHDITGDWWLGSLVRHGKPGKGFVWRVYPKKGLGTAAKDWHFPAHLLGDGTDVYSSPQDVSNNKLLTRQLFGQDIESTDINRNYATRFQIGVTGWPDFPHNAFKSNNSHAIASTYNVGYQIIVKQYYHFKCKELKY